MENPYKPPKSEPPKTEETDPDWIYREYFAYGIMGLALFYIMDTIFRMVQSLNK
tara:strand:+ start:1384 stop:1545 length:162 start_codon:yes stop_codon:yes gene_type:complete